MVLTEFQYSLCIEHASIHRASSASEAVHRTRANAVSEPSGFFSVDFFEEWFPQRAERARKPDEKKGTFADALTISTLRVKDSMTR